VFLELAVVLLQLGEVFLQNVAGFRDQLVGVVVDLLVGVVQEVLVAFGHGRQDRGALLGYAALEADREDVGAARFLGIAGDHQRFLDQRGGVGDAGKGLHALQFGLPHRLGDNQRAFNDGLVGGQVVLVVRQAGIAPGQRHAVGLFLDDQDLGVGPVNG